MPLVEFPLREQQQKNCRRSQTWVPVNVIQNLFLCPRRSSRPRPVTAPPVLLRGCSFSRPV